jgi:dolichol-phosphate mannosyltransferase
VREFKKVTYMQKNVLNNSSYHTEQSRPVSYGASKLSIIIPVWNEKNTIREIIRKVEALTIPDWVIEIVVVDDASTDGTRNIVKEYESRHRVVYHDTNKGKGSAVTTGIANATGEYLLIQDADLEYNPEEIPRLVQAIGNNANRVVYGSRNIEIKDRKMMIIPRLGVWFITFEFNVLFGTKLTDLWTCYKLFPKRAGRYFEAGHFESELSFSARLVKNGFEIIEVPISHKPRTFGEGKKIRYRDGMKGIWVIIREKFTS